MKLLLDIGASSIKSIIKSKSELIKESFLKTEPLSINHEPVVNVYEARKKIFSHLQEQKKYDFEEIWLCSEMHNFFLEETINEKFSPFVSWRYFDETSKKNKYKIEKEISDYINFSGQNLHLGVPILNFKKFIIDSKTFKLRTLPDLLTLSGNSSNKIHNSMAASLGFLNLKNETWIKEFLELLYPNVRFKMPDILSEDENPYLGSLNFNNREVGVFGGFGDMQTALYGSSLREGQIGVNIGTGSQIAQISSNIPDKRKKIDLKPFFGKFINSITHIPAGRSFNYIEKNLYKKNDFWEKLSEVNFENKESNSDLFNLNIFENNWRYSKKNLSHIKSAFKKNQNSFPIILDSFCNEYRKALSLINETKEFDSIVLSGGKLKELKFVKTFFSNLDGYRIQFRSSNEIDETLIGLHKLSSL